MRQPKILLIFIFLIVSAVSGRAQNTGTPLAGSGREAAVSVKREEQQIRQSKAAGDKQFEALKEGGKREPVINVVRSLSAFSITPNKEQRKLLLPDGRDAVKYAAFLKQPKTGLIKLLPDLGCEENARILRVDNECLSWIPTSAFYSFREKEHTREFLSDIKLEKGSLISNGFLAQGILVALGNTPLEELSLAGDGMKFLVDFTPEVESVKALERFNSISRGFDVGKHFYRNHLPALENMTYALRIVAYRGKVYRSYQGRPFDILYGDNRVDLIVAFRVVKKERNGAVILLWKEMDRKKSPKVLFKTKEKSAGRKTGS